MADPGHRRSHHRRKSPGLRRAWCCSFGVAPQSPENRGSSAPRRHHSHQPPSKPQKLAYAASFQSSPSPSAKMGLGIIDPRRILSPGRVSPIDSDAPPFGPLPGTPGAASVAAGTVDSESECVDPLPKEKASLPGRLSSSSSITAEAGVSDAPPKERSMDLRLSLKGKDGKCLVLELDSEVLCHGSSFFAAMVLDARRKASDASAECRKIEVAEIEDLSVFKDTVELMYEKDTMKCLVKSGVSRSIDILEVSSTIMFSRGVISCLKYLEAVPWNENEEEKLKSLFARCSFDEAIAQDVLARLYGQVPNNTQDLAVRLVRSVVNGTNGKARKELQTLVNCLLSKSSVYQKKPAGLSKEGLYGVCNSCLNSLLETFGKASDSIACDRTCTVKETRPAIERISRQVDSLNWLLEILIDKQMAEEFVVLWANQNDLLRLHEAASPMVRYEISRISASVFMALGRGKLQCPGEVRYGVLRAWFGPMLSDFGWLQRCSKGLDVRRLEEDMGQAILTLSLPQQQALFVEWFRRFSVQGSECPNLSKAFQVWWRRSFVRPADARG
uniref:BTB/POZ domain-containing protein At2g13690 n=1 Tax=Anthurium amnicola TaxID=1678845 RepID=A0A1D1XXA5_9ARAE